MTRQLAGAAVLFAAYLFLHLPVEDFFDMLARRFGFETYDRFALIGFMAGGVAVLVAAWTWPSGRRVLVGIAMTALVALTAVAQRLIVVASIENIHYPQYALLLWALARGLPSVESAWLVATGLGALDEAYQYVALPRGTPDYFDWNDVLLNAIGATFGVVIMLMLGRVRGERSPFYARAVLVTAVAVVVVAFIVDPPVLSPFYTHTPGGRPFHKLSAAEAAIVSAALWAAVRSFERRAVVTSSDECDPSTSSRP
ncbi:MAG: VanZ family protein [Vicinamibacterales bacterium]